MNFPVSFDMDQEMFTYEYEDEGVEVNGHVYCCTHHAHQAAMRQEREDRKRRDREELQDVWRDEVRRRKRERFFNRAWVKK